MKILHASLAAALLLATSLARAEEPVAEPPPVPAPILDPGVQFKKSEGWKLILDPANRRGVAMRRTLDQPRHLRPALIAWGATTLILAHLVPPSLNVALTSRYDIGPIDTILGGMLPAVGPFIAASFTQPCSTDSQASYSCTVNVNWTAIWVVSGVFRLAGTAAIIIGARYGKLRIEQIPFTLAVAPTSGGMMVGALGRF